MVVLSDFAEERRAQIKAINAQNKRRGKQMEQRVMKFLKGNRVPMSGSGSIKGDGQIFSKFGYILVECKTSSAHDGRGDQKLSVNFQWLPKMQVEAMIMRAKFAVLVFHHQDAKQDYVMLRAGDFARIAGLTELQPIKVIPLPKSNCWTTKRKLMELDFLDYTVYTIVETSDGPYAVCTLRRFGELLEEDIDESDYS